MSVHSFTERKPGPYQSQHGEDAWLERHFAGKKGFFVEVGAYDGIVLSNTYLLESLGWSGVLVEPDPGKAVRCRQNRPRCRVFECAAVSSPEVDHITFHVVEGGEVYSTSSMTPLQKKRIERWGLQRIETTVKARTLDSMLAEVDPPSVDFVSIDVEGAEIEVLRGFDLARWRPSVVMIEVNARFRSREIRDVFTRQGYVYRESISINDIYVPIGDLRSITETVDRVRYGLHRSQRFARSAALRVAKLFGYEEK